MNQSTEKFPAVTTHPLYWDIKARLEERRGNTLEALNIYDKAAMLDIQVGFIF